MRSRSRRRSAPSATREEELSLRLAGGLPGAPSVGKEKLLAIDPIVGDNLLTLIRNQPVDEGLTLGNIYLRDF